MNIFARNTCNSKCTGCLTYDFAPENSGYAMGKQDEKLRNILRNS
ncbi:hypothetical protein PUN28_018771 [Cardiocondyla obscurior]|uniref:Radical SAM protein n=1 Tax=Cardiocondyla obscurior TaxID=286306 RepID=A0AAW2EDT4_9HYME